jgi:cyclophilin family peptidyl-prolyl cis-trans isomerase
MYWYKGSSFHKIVSTQYIMGGDLFNRNGTGSATIYSDGGQKTIEAEQNLMKFTEPYLLCASANDKGEIGSQFFITMKPLQALNGSKNTIFGRVL